MKGSWPQAARNSSASVTDKPHTWNMKNKPTGFLASFTQAHILTHIKKKKKKKIIKYFHKKSWWSKRDSINPPSYKTRKLDKINNSFQTLDNSQTRVGSLKKGRKMRWALQLLHITPWSSFQYAAYIYPYNFYTIIFGIII